MKNIFILSIIYTLLFSTVGASFQDYSGNSFQRRNPIIFIETHVLPNDTLLDCYISYKISNKNLVFVKSDSVYTGGIDFFLEIEKDDQVIGRESSKREIELRDYKSTNSGNGYLEGMLKITLEKGNYFFIPSISIHNTEETILLNPYTLILEREFDNNLAKPIIIKDETFSIGDMTYNPIANFQNFIPFSSHDYNIVFPLGDQDIDTLLATVKQGNEVTEFVLSRETAERSVSFEYSNNHVYLELGPGNRNMNIFILEKINQNLREGLAEITLTANGEEIKTFSYNVVWIDKPRSLRNIEYAIKLLNNVTNEATVDTLLDFPDDEQYSELINYWKNKDPRRDTSFNELMNEFYKRADYANDNFSTVDYSGTSLDRGKIYLRYGPPTNTERIFYDKANVVEIWYYKKLNKEFYFNDKSGLGNFSLMN